MADLQVSLHATRYVDAVVGLRLARLYWRRIDRVLVAIPGKGNMPEWGRPYDVLRTMDHALANSAQALLLDAPASDEEQVFVTAELVRQPLLQHAGEWLDVPDAEPTRVAPAPDQHQLVAVHGVASHPAVHDAGKDHHVVPGPGPDGEPDRGPRPPHARPAQADGLASDLMRALLGKLTRREHVAGPQPFHDWNLAVRPPIPFWDLRSPAVTFALRLAWVSCESGPGHC